jgi:hypothetical protein
MKRIIACLVTLAISLLATFVTSGLDIKDGPFDGTPFHPNVPINWGITLTIPEILTVYKLVNERVPQTMVSNAMVIGSFKSRNLVRSQDKGLIEFRDTPKKEDLTRFLKMSANRGWVKYNDNRAEVKPVHGVPSFEEADERTLRYFILFGGNTNQIAPKPRPHHESTFESYDKPGGRLIAKGVSRRYVCLFRQLDGVPIIDDYFSVDFGNDAKPITLEMNWPPLQPVQHCKTATRDEILQFLKSGKTFYPVWPEQPNVSSAKAFIVKSIQYLYKRGLGVHPQELLRPYASLGMEAEIDGKPVKLGLNCPIITDEKVR